MSKPATRTRRAPTAAPSPPAERANGMARRGRGASRRLTAAALGLDAPTLLHMYEVMLLARLTDERQWIMQRQGKQAFHISCQGHEASGVASAFALDRTRDIIAPYYRSLAVCLAFGMTPRDVLLGALAKAEDPSSGGRQMPAHPGPKDLNILTSGSPVATQIPHATGAALAAKIRGTGGVAVAYFGDGASSKGDFHEGLNFAGVHKLPALFICENNHYAISVPTEKQMAVRSVAERGPGYGMPGVSVDGTDVLAVYDAVKEAAARARAGEGPTLLESNVPRITPHSSDDDDRRYRPERERREARAHDPLVVFSSYLHAEGLLDDARDEELHARGRAEVEQASQEAEAAADPEAASAFDHVYANSRVPDFRAALPRLGKAP